jgi:NitT/TauT family transport system substrate-binding protein
MYLVEHRIDPASVTVSFYPAADLPDALKNGKVDAITAFEPYAYLSGLAMPGKTITLPKSALFRETFNLVAMKAWAGQHPETLKKIIRAVDKAITFVQQNKQETISILVKNTKFSKEMLEAVWEDYIYEITLDNSMLAGLEDEARWAIQNKLVSTRTAPNYLDYYYLDAMKAVKPESVSIIK